MNRYKITGLLVDMDVSGRTYEQAQPYRSEETGPADITLTLDKAVEDKVLVDAVTEAGYEVVSVQ